MSSRKIYRNGSAVLWWEASGCARQCVTGAMWRQALTFTDLGIAR